LSLRDERCKFSLDLAKLVIFIASADGGRYDPAIDQVKRTKDEAVINAQTGKGITNSLHLIGLAADVLIYNMGEYLTDSDDYRFAGDYWKSIDPMNRWGGDFKDSGGRSKPDGNHFSREYQGRK